MRGPQWVPSRSRPELPLDVEQQVEERPGLESGLDLGDGVQERRLLLVAPRLGLDDRRQPRAPRSALRLRRIVCLAVAEVRAEADVGEGCHIQSDGVSIDGV